MAKIEADATETFKDILPKLVEFQNFKTYLDSLPFQTIQMENKQTLRLNDYYSDEIVCIESAYSSYVDDAFFKTRMGEIPLKNSHKTFPVSIQTVKMGWILSTEEGTKFLRKILTSENSDIFESQTTIFITEFMYKYYRRMILIWRLPVYII